MDDIKELCDSLREQVNATINPDNGLKSITGAATKLMFLNTIDAIEAAAQTGGGGGSSAFVAYASLDELTAEQIDANKKLYTALLAVVRGEASPVSVNIAVNMGGTIAVMSASFYSENRTPDGTLIAFTGLAADETFAVITLSADGATEIIL